MDGLFPYFPVFLDLAGRRVVLCGEGAAMERLAQALLAAGAGVVRYAAGATEAAKDAPGGRSYRRRWRGADFRNAALVVIAEGEARVHRARTAAKAAGAIFHSLDETHASEIALGAAVARGTLAIGVTAQGLPLAIEQALRAHVERALPVGLVEFAAAVVQARPAIDARFAEAGAVARDAFLVQLAESAFAAPQSDWPAWIAERLARA